MANLFIFGIGGSGSRVLRSLVMLLSSGIDINADRIIPLIIDTDKNNGDLSRFKELNEFYRKINSGLYHNIDKNNYRDHFFRREIEEVKVLNIGELEYKSLHEMLNYGKLGQIGLSKTKYLIDLLFEENELTKNLDKGFYGKPNIGSIVLRDIVASETFQEFTQQIASGDRIFIISSIFGGTGAAGYPLLLKLFRDPNQEFNNVNFINNAIIGGLTVLPYFEVTAKEYTEGSSCINSATFITKTKAALSYYDSNIQNLVNFQYYITDPVKSTFDNIEGGAKQKNNSHFVEFAAASSIIHFMNQNINANVVSDLNEKVIQFGEFGIREIENETNISLWNLYKESDYSFLVKPFIMFYLFCYMLKNSIVQFENNKIVWVREIGSKIDSSFKDDITAFSIMFYDWLNELQDVSHQRKFIPFDLHKSDSQNILSSIRNLPINSNVDINVINSILNSLNDPILKKQINKLNLQFINLMFNGLSKVYAEQKIAFSETLV